MAPAGNEADRDVARTAASPGSGAAARPSPGPTAASPGAQVKILLLKAGSVVQTIAAQAPLGADGAGSFSWLIPVILEQRR